jgi:hypothetical protein
MALLRKSLRIFRDQCFNQFAESGVFLIINRVQKSVATRFDRQTHDNAALAFKRVMKALFNRNMFGTLEDKRDMQFCCGQFFCQPYLTV